APADGASAGVAADFNNAGGTQAVTVSAATYTADPTSGNPINAGGGFVDLRVNGADVSDSMTAHFYYPSSVQGAEEDALVLLYCDGANWVPVLSGGGVAPQKDTADNIGGTVSGGRFTVLFDGTSTPSVTSLSGNVFALTLTPPSITA